MYVYNLEISNKKVQKPKTKQKKKDRRNKKIRKLYKNYNISNINKYSWTSLWTQTKILFPKNKKSTTIFL